MSLDINNQSNHADTAVYADSGNLVLVSRALEDNKFPSSNLEISTRYDQEDRNILKGIRIDAWY